MGFFETFVALRYLKARRARGFLSLSTFISVAGVAVGVMALLVVIGVMTGFDQDLKKKILSVNANIIVLKQGSSLTDYREMADRLKSVPEVVEVDPFIYTQVMLSAPGNISGGVVRGLDLDTIRRGGPKSLQVSQGRFADIADVAPGEPPGRPSATKWPATSTSTWGTTSTSSPPWGPSPPWGACPA